MCCDESVFLDLQWHTRDQLSKWSYTNNEYWKSALFKFVMISQTGIFNAVRITNSIKCVWYWLSTGILSLPLPAHLFIYFFFVCVAMWIDRSARRHGPRAHVWDKKTSWVEEFGVTWANKVVKKKSNSRVQLSSGNDIWSFEQDVERNQAKNRRVKL